MLSLCTKPFSTSTLTRGVVEGSSSMYRTIIISGNKTPLAPDILWARATIITCLPPAARVCTTGGRTTGISVTQEQVVTVTVFSRRGVSPEARKTVAGLLVLLTTLTEVVLRRAKVKLGIFSRPTVCVLKKAVKTLSRVVVFSKKSPGPDSNGLKLATVLTFRKTRGGQTFSPMFRQRHYSRLFRLKRR